MTQVNPNPLAMGQPNVLADKQNIRCLVYGEAKSRKTWWAATAAETHRVTILDGDNNTNILNNLPEEWKPRVQKIPLAGQPNYPAMVIFLSSLFKLKDFLWDLDKEQVTPLSLVKTDGRYLDVSLSRMSTDDVLIIDSWTKLCTDTGVQYATSKNIDPMAGKKKEFDFYGYQDLVLDAILGAMNCLPCHLIVTGHEQFYTTKVKDGVIEKDVTKLQLVSSTGKHAAKLPAHVSDVLWFKRDGEMKTMIETAGNEYRAGGCASLPPAKYDFDTWKFSDYAKLAGYEPAKSLEWPYPNPFQYVTGETLLQASQNNQAQNPVGVIKGNV